MGMSQRALGEVLGVTFQQVQKYERGTNRIAVSTLVRAADALNTPVSFFLEGFGPDAPAPARKALQNHRALSTDVLDKIDDKKVRAAVRTLLRALTPGNS